MKNHILNTILLILSVIGITVGYLFTNSVQFGLCGADAYGCRSLFNEIGDSLLYGMTALSLVFFILLFIPRAFSAWWKFAIWYVPLAIFIFATIPPPSHSWIFPGFNPDAIYRWISCVYVAISLLIIGLVSLKKRPN